MSYVRRVAYSATNTQDAVDKIKDDMVSMGWTLHDDLSGSSPYSYVLYSNGENSDKPRAYVQILAGDSANKLGFKHWLYWDNSAHSGTGQLLFGSYANYLGADDDGPFYLWVYGDKSGVVVVTKLGSAYAGAFCVECEPFFTTPYGVLQSGVSSGSDVVLTLGAGEADDFEAGYDYQIIGISSEGRQKVTCSAVNSGSNQITVSSLSYNFGAGAIIGATPYPWVSGLHIGIYCFPHFNTNGTGAETAYSQSSEIGSYTYWDPEGRTQKYPLTPLLVYERNNVGLYGVVSDYFLRCYISTVDEETIDTGRQDSGTSSGSNTSTTLNDTAKSWSVNGYANKGIVITGGTGAGQVRKISSNTATEITVDAAWDTTPDATSTYIVADHIWRYFYFASNGYSKAIREV